MMERKMALLAIAVMLLASLWFASVSSGEISVSLSKSVSKDEPEPGESITYTIEVSSSSPLWFLEITDVLPLDVSYDSSSASCGTVTVSEGQITWTMLVLNAKTESLEIQVVVGEVAPGTEITNTAAITGCATLPNLELSADAVITVADGGNTPPPILEVEIDIKPGSDQNLINPDSNGVIPVAILGSETFDVTEIDGGSVVFGPNEAKPVHGDGHLEDVNGDGFIDWIGHFRVQVIGIVFDNNTNEAELKLKGYISSKPSGVQVSSMSSSNETSDVPFEASDKVARVGKPGKTKKVSARGAPGLRLAGITTWGNIRSS